jgi:type IV pilus assembly protein PilC
MGRDAEDPLPPRKPKGAPAGAKPVPGEIREGASTFQPANDNRPGKPTAGTGRITREPKIVSGGPTWVERIVFGSVSTAHLAQFCRQFAAYLDAGVDLVKTMASLEQQFARTALGPVIGRLLLSVRRGEALAEGMAREPAAFDSLFLSLMKVAEARGGVPETLRGLANHYDARLRLFRQARSAMIYPVIVLIVAGGVIALLSLFVLPKLVDMLADIAGRGNGVDLPFASRVLMGFSHFVQALGWWLVPLATVGLFVFLFKFYKTPVGKAWLDELALYVPVLGKLLRKIDTTRFAHTLSALLEGGVDIGASLDLTASVMHLTPFRRALERARVQVMEGHELSDALRDSGRFGPDVVAIVNSGEETGKLPESLERLGDDYEEQVTYMVKNLGSLVQPLIMIFMGGVVLFIILAVLLPYISLLTNLAH